MVTVCAYTELRAISGLYLFIGQGPRREAMAVNDKALAMLT